MISHTTLGTNNLAKAQSFYDEILSKIGGRQLFKSDKVIFWEFEGSTTKLAITVPFDGELATFGNGNMTALSLKSESKVDEVFAIALRLGATSEGEPGLRNDGAYYGAYFRDLDGNKIAVFYR